jgi:hypothetical protein
MLIRLPKFAWRRLFLVPSSQSCLQHLCSVQRGETSTLVISSFTDFALAGNRGKDSNHASHLWQCQRWRMTLSSKNSDLCGAIISWLHRTHWIPNMNIERCFFIVVRRLKSSVNAEDLPRDYLSYVTASETINHFSLSLLSRESVSHSRSW